MDRPIDFLMEPTHFKWVLVFMMLSGICFILFTGRIRYQGWHVIDREVDPKLYWLHVAGWSIVAIALFADAIF